RLRQTEHVRQQVDDRPVRLAFLRSCGDVDPQGVGVETRQGIAASAGSGLDPDDDALRMGFQRGHRGSPSTSDEPIRTIVAPSAIASRKSPLIPMESSRSSTLGGELVASLSRNCRSAAKLARATDTSPPRAAIVIRPAMRTFW